MNQKRALIFLIGQSGSGKDTAAAYLCEQHGFHRVASYTTRQRRLGEENGREHTFITWGSVAHDPDTWLAHRGLHMLAKTVYGGHYYFTAKEQLTHRVIEIPGRGVKHKPTAGTDDTSQPILHPYELLPLPARQPVIYIIDEKGLMDMLADPGNVAWLNDNFRYEVWTILRDEETLEDMPLERLARDNGRTPLPLHLFNWVIHNDGKQLSLLYDQLSTAVRESEEFIYGTTMHGKQ